MCMLHMCVGECDMLYMSVGAHLGQKRQNPLGLE